MLNVTSMFSILVTTTTKHISMTSLPVQGVKGASSTHSFITDQARQILENDGYKKAAQVFNIFDEQLENGVVWVDKGLKSTCHYYDPDTGTGMWLWPNAAQKCADFFYKSLSLWQRKKHTMAMFFLGAATHLVQDVCVPHHAACKMFNCHLEYENWVEKRKKNYLVDCGGIYGISNKPEEWISENARLAKEYFHSVGNGTQEGYHKATKELLPRAQFTTAGFLLNFYNQL
jgi:phospholipase C